MPVICDGPNTSRFAPVAIAGKVNPTELPTSLVSGHTIEGVAHAAAWKRMRPTPTAVHRKLHNRMHTAGVFHDHTPTTDHPEHH